MQTVNIRQMKPKQSGTIAAVSAEGALGKRIRDMGLVPGTRITLQGRARCMIRWHCGLWGLH